MSILNVLSFPSRIATMPPKSSSVRFSKFSPLYKYRDSLLLAVLVVALSPLFFVQVHHVHAASLISYNCTSNPRASSGHCYGVNFWGGANGADTRITLNETSGGNGFIDNEMWLLTSNAQYWVEVGETSDAAFSVYDGSAFFWADQRPNGGHAEHFSGYLTGSDWGKSALTRITRSGTSAWNVSVSDGVTSLTGTSTANDISIGNIEIGMEVYGSSGASAPVNHFTYNRWLNSGGNFQYQTNNGVGTNVYSPVAANWTTLPTNSSTGGDWYTCISGSGC